MCLNFKKSILIICIPILFGYSYQQEGFVSLSIWFIHIFIFYTQRQVCTHTLTTLLPQRSFLPAPCPGKHTPLTSKSRIPSNSSPPPTTFHYTPRRTQLALLSAVNPGKEFRIFLEENRFLSFHSVNFMRTAQVFNSIALVFFFFLIEPSLPSAS